MGACLTRPDDAPLVSSYGATREEAIQGLNVALRFETGEAPPLPFVVEQKNGLFRATVEINRPGR